MPDSKSYLQPDTLDRVSRFELRARDIVEGLLSGMHRSPYFGQSLEFRQHREYTPGDDIRHIDWKVWARQDRFYIKQYEEDTNLNLLVAVDTSSSMRYGKPGQTKFDHGATLAACLAYLVLRQHDRVASVTFDTTINGSVPLSNQRRQLRTISEAFEQAKPQDKTSLRGAVKGIVDRFPRRGIVAFISDLLIDEKEIEQAIAQLRHHGHDLLLFHVLHDDELHFPFTGPMRFEGLESSDHLNCNPRALREGYLDALHEYLRATRRLAAKFRADYQLVSTKEPLSQVLTECLTRRMERDRRR